MRFDVEYRAFASRFLTGLTVVTSRSAGIDYGCAANAFTSISADPPLALLCLNVHGSTARAVAESGRLCVNILAHGDEGMKVSQRFSRDGQKSFHGLSRTVSGLAAIPGRLATGEFEVVRIDEIQDRAVIYCSPVQLDAEDTALPLAYWHSRVGGLRVADHSMESRPRQQAALSGSECCQLRRSGA